jgi:[ribosomal protein S5]-alanine N-acetyltransferase
MIRGKNVCLRMIRESDLARLIEKMNDLDLRGEWFPHTLASEVTIRKEFDKNGLWSNEFGRMVVCDKEGKVVGGIWFFQIARYIDGLEIGYMMFDRENRNRGMMTEAVRLLTDYLFATKKINRLQLAIMIPNEPSKRVAQKCGYKFEGIARGAVFQRGQSEDVEMYSILRGETPGSADASPEG